MIERDGRPGLRVRLGVKGGGCSGFEYVIRLEETTRDTDLALTLEDIDFICDPKSAAIVGGSTLRWTGNLLAGGGFQFDNPNAERSCGCGSSFSLKKPV